MKAIAVLVWLLSDLAAFSAQLTATSTTTPAETSDVLVILGPEVPLSCDTVNDAFLQGYWRLDETSGDAVDSKGSNTLTDHNAVGAQTGKIGTSREFTAATVQFFSISDNAAVSTGDIDFTIWASLRFGGTLTSGTFPGVVSKWGGVQQEYTLYLSGDSNRLAFAVSSTGSDTTTVYADNFGDVPGSTWMFAVVWHDASANTLNIQIGSDASPDLTAVNTVSYSLGVRDGTADFTIGSIGAGFNWTGQIDEVGFSKRILTANERIALFNHHLICRPAGLP